MWPTPERTSQPPPEELNPLVKLLMDFSTTQESLLEDHFFLSFIKQIQYTPMFGLLFKKLNKQPTVV